MTSRSVTSGRSDQSQVDAARAYESLFVAALFGQWATKVADAAQVQAGQRVLDVACGTGVLAREASARTGPTGYVAGLDPGPGMLAVAKELAPAVDWRHGTADSIRFADGLFELATERGQAWFSSILREAEGVLGEYAAADGQVRFEVSAHVATTVKA